MPAVSLTAATSPDPVDPAALRAELSRLAATYRDHAAQASRAWSKEASEEALAGLSPRDLARARARGEAHGHDGPLVCLDGPSYAALMARADDRELRREVYEAQATRASDHGPRAGQFDNGPVVLAVLAARHALARATGFHDFAELSCKGTPIGSADDVERAMLRDVRALKARAQTELDALWAFAKEKGVPKGFAVWDLSYYEVLRAREELGFDAEALRPFLAVQSVVRALSELAGRLLGVVVHADLTRPECFTLTASRADGSPLGSVELLPHAFADTWTGAFFERVESTAALRVSCAADPAFEGLPASFALGDLPALATAFGEALGALLAPAESPLVRARVAALFALVAGTPGGRALILRDGRGEAPPAELLATAERAEALHAALHDALELERVMFDLRLHRDYVPPDKATQLRVHVRDTLAQVRSELCVLRPPFWERMASTARDVFDSERSGRLWLGRWARLDMAGPWAAALSAGLDGASLAVLRARVGAPG
jgi:oligopeptidase A